MIRTGAELHKALAEFTPERHHGYFSYRRFPFLSRYSHCRPRTKAFTRLPDATLCAIGSLQIRRRASTMSQAL